MLFINAFDADGSEDDDDDDEETSDMEDKGQLHPLVSVTKIKSEDIPEVPPNRSYPVKKFF